MTEIHVEGLRELQAAFDKAPEIAAKELRRAMRVSVDEGERQIKGRTPVGVTGDLRKSISGSVEGQLPEIRGIITTPLQRRGWPVERGRKVGKWPPEEPIMLWVIRKPLPPEPGQTVEDVTFLVRRAIGTGKSKGIMRPGGGAKMFEKGIKAALSSIKKAFEAALDRFASKMRKR